MKKISLIAIVMVLLTSCTKKTTLDNIFVSSTKDKDLSSLISQNLITTEDSATIVNWFENEEFYEEDSLTYGYIVDQVRAYKEKESKNQKIIEELNKIVAVSFVKKEAATYWGVRKVVFDVEVSNKSDRDINGYTVTVTFRNGAGEMIYEATWSLTQPVKANSTAKTKCNMSYENSDYEKLSIIEAADINQLKLDYKVSQIIYSDGTVEGIE